MQKIILYTVVVLVSFISKLYAQENDSIRKHEKFKQKVEKLSETAELYIFKEKTELKFKIDSLNKLFENNKISFDEFQDEKMNFAKQSASKIENEIGYQKEIIDSIYNNKISFESKNFDFKIDTINGKREYKYFRKNDGRIFTIPNFKIYESDIDKVERQQKRTTSQFVFAFGLNNVITENESLNDSDYRVWGSHFYEWGLTYNTRIFKNHNLLHAKYGLSLMYNNLRPTDNRYFVKNGNSTELQAGFTNFDESRFRNVYLTAPVHLEFDFSPKKINKDGNSYFRTHQSFRLGIGGYAGVKIKSKQILKYEEDDQKIKTKQKGDFNVNDFNYGLSAYVGYGQLSLYAKYDINPLFKNNTVDQNNVSLGLRFDFN